MPYPDRTGSEPGSLRVPQPGEQRLRRSLRGSPGPVSWPGEWEELSMVERTLVIDGVGRSGWSDAGDLLAEGWSLLAIRHKVFNQEESPGP